VGYGRWRQPGAVPFAEFCVITPRHSSALALRLAKLGAFFSLREPDAAPWGDWHRVHIGPLELAAPEYVAVVLSPWKTHRPAPDHQVVHLRPVLVTEAELEVPLDELLRWLTPEKLQEFSKRWVRDLPAVV
jgi:hypothetical protein